MITMPERPAIPDGSRRSRTAASAWAAAAATPARPTSSSVSIDGGTNEACVKISKLGVGDSGGGPTATMLQQTTFDCGAGIHCWMAGIAVNREQLRSAD